MAAFRVLSASDVSEILEGYGFPPGAYLRHQSIAVGTINTNLRVETTGGSRFLRVNEGKALSDVEREAAIVEYLAPRDVPTPSPFRAANESSYLQWRGELVSLFPWLPGRTLNRGELTVAHAHQVGAALARLHVAGADFPDHRLGRYEPDQIARRLARVGASAASDPLLANAVAMLGPELAALEAERDGSIPLGLIHGDLFIDNVLYEDERLVALLDFEQAAWGRLAYDLAVTTLAFGFGQEDFRPEILRALFGGYVTLRPLSDAERVSFGVELRFAACRFAVTRITDVYLKRSKGAAPGKDFRRYLKRLERVHHHLRAGSDLLDPMSPG